MLGPRVWGREMMILQKCVGASRVAFSHVLSPVFSGDRHSPFISLYLRLQGIDIDDFVAKKRKKAEREEGRDDGGDKRKRKRMRGGDDDSD